MTLRTMLAGAVLLVTCGTLAIAQDKAATPIGWRGNSTGLFPDAQVPAEWSNISTGPIQGLKCATSMPADSSDKDAVPVEGGLVTQWLAIGPFNIDDANKDFDKEVIADEAKLAPKLGDKAGDLEWIFATPVTEGVTFKNVSIAPGKSERNRTGYLATYLYAPTPGKAQASIEHVTGVKVYVNGKVVYSSPKQITVVSSAYGLSRNRVANLHPVGPAFEYELQKGWNRLLIKCVAPNLSQWNQLTVMLRLMDLPDGKYDRKNIQWMTPLPDRGNGTPIMVGDKVFITAEPDELVCIDKKSGKVLWNAITDYYSAIPQSQVDANPAFKEKGVADLEKAVKEAPDIVTHNDARRKLQETLVAIDKAKYTKNPSGHLAAHFEIVGYSTTPCSDGKFVYVWVGDGVAACYDLNGNRKWATRIPAGPEIHYSASPAVIGGRVAVGMEHLCGLDTKTGEIAWEQKSVGPGVASVLAAKIAGTEVFITQKGDIVRASDGKLLWNNPHKIPNDTGWAAPVVVGDVIYVPWNGISMVIELDCTGCTGDEWKVKETVIGDITKGVQRRAGDQGDPWMCASPLVADGLMYCIDIHSEYYVIDLKARKQIAHKTLTYLTGEDTYVSVRQTASPTLVGKFIVVMDNQGHSVTLEQGAEMKEIAHNNLATQLPRDCAMTPIEYTAYAPPIADGKRMYLRGERYLYCIGKE